ncbi:sulfotransferase [Shewanella baltica]|uniref:sulfotransferase n=1 Tax=Shewanella baltica TaxID=62322 RepID=UPI00217F1B24|nr:sulfotransferase [Shewanella baltica]MCS6096590.1 sulfotransferase [Shewanella baltica]MCS6227698.1 sulfotransferase [Shewanella baltica]MCS6232746.1 sulfotransferase [Shewanella baltica]
MSQQFHFISGLPRSGSTLLAGILKQNPRFHAAMSSPVAGLVNGALEQMGAASESYSFFDETKRKTICRALVDAYYADKTQPVIFDTNRNWTARLHQIVELVDDFKVICCVRNPAWIMDSFEVIYRKNPFDYSRMFNAANRQTVYSRCDSLINAAGAVGSAWTALKEAYYGEFSDRLLLIDYDILTHHPTRTIELLYQFLGEVPFAHNFDQVDYEESEFDQKLGVKGLHSVRKKVEFKSRRSILPPDLFAKYQDMDFWQDKTGTAAHIIAATKTSVTAE